MRQIRLELKVQSCDNLQALSAAALDEETKKFLDGLIVALVLDMSEYIKGAAASFIADAKHQLPGWVVHQFIGTREIDLPEWRHTANPV